MKTLSTILLAALTASGCASVHHIRRPEDAAAAYSEINRRAERRDARVTLTSGETVHARRLQMSADSSTWLNARAGQPLRVATQDIQKVQFLNRDTGTLMGAGIGALGGALLMGAVMRADGYDWDASLAIAGAVTPFSALPGALIGATRGNRKVYRFPVKE